MSRKKLAFTLIELLVVIAIIGILATISILALSNARAKSRDAKRAGDVKQIQTALELFFNDKGRYPTSVEFNSGSIYSTSSSGTSTYMLHIPLAPTPADGNCSSGDNSYIYSQIDNGNNYSLDFCLGGQVASLAADSKCLTSNGILNSDCCSSFPVSYNDEVYNTVRIGGQCWFKENLKTTKYNDGSDIPNLTLGTDWTNTTDGAYSWFLNNYATWGSVYGGLYNFYAVDTGKLCPSGWHVPTDTELKILVEGQATAGCESSIGWQCSPAGSHLSDYTLNHDNASGFSALMGGYRNFDGSFYDITTQTYLWSSSINGLNPWYRWLHVSRADVYRQDYYYGSIYGFSVRCLRN